MLPQFGCFVGFFVVVVGGGFFGFWCGFFFSTDVLPNQSTLQPSPLVRYQVSSKGVESDLRSKRKNK